MDAKFFLKAFLLVLLSSFCLAQENSQENTTVPETQETESDFQEWKSKKEARWGERPDETKQAWLLSGVLRNLETLKKNHSDTNTEKEALYAYNFLRDLRHFPRAKNFSELDLDWLRANKCAIYNAYIERRVNSLGLKTNSEKKIYLLSLANITYLKRVASSDDAAEQAYALCAYNSLRGLYDQPLAISFNKIDYEWLTEIEVKVFQEFAQEVNAEYEQLMQEQKTIKPENAESEKTELEDKRSFLTSLKGLPENFKQQALSLVNNLLENLSHYTTLLSRKALSMWDAYKAWKEEKVEEWDNEDLPEAARRYYLLDTVNLAVDNEQLREIALFAYNFLREKLDLPLAQNFSQLDLKWLQAQDYPLWKDYFDSFTEKFGKTRLDLLLGNLGIWLENRKNHPDDEGLKKKILYGYNYVREIKGQPLIKSLNRLNIQWLKDVSNKQILADLNVKEPTFAQAELLREAAAIIDLKHELSAGSTGDPFLASTRMVGVGRSFFPLTIVITLCTDLDLDWRLFVTYHELGHVVNEKDYQNLEAAKNYDQIMAQPQFGEDIKQVDYYLELGKKAFDDSSSFGKRMRLIAPLFKTFWIPPQDELLKKEILYKRNKEKRADLFALEELYKQNKIDTILSIINYWGSRAEEASKIAFVINSREHPDYIHPSYLERAFYLAGFLVDKGIDINKAFKEWENTRQCIDAERAYAKKRQAQTKTPYTQGERALQELLSKSST